MLPFGLSTAISATDKVIQKNHGPETAVLIILNDEIEDLMRVVESLEESESLIKGIIETIKNDSKEQKGGFLPMLLRTLPTSILGNALTGKEVIKAGEWVIEPVKM